MFFEERVAWILNKIKEREQLTNEKLGQILGVNKNTIAAYCKGKGDLKGVALAGIVREYGINGAWLIGGFGEPFPGACDKYPDVCGPPPPVPAFPERERSDESSSDDFVFIRQVRGKISAGGGLSPDDVVDLKLAFRKDWIKRKGDPTYMSLIKVQGDSMEPTLSSGDLVLVDHSKKSIAPQGGIYAISFNHEIMIKRVQILFPEGRLRIISDNKQYEPIEAPVDQVRVNGKVIWYGRDLER